MIMRRFRVFYYVDAECAEGETIESLTEDIIVDLDSNINFLYVKDLGVDVQEVPR